MPTNCFSFAPRDSVPGLIAKICKYLKNHPGWSEEELKDEIAKLVHDAGVQSFNGRTGNVVLSSEDVNALKIASAYFGEGDETIDELDIKALYAAGIRFVFMDFNSVTSSYNNFYVLDYFPGSDDIAYYPISTADGGGGSVTVAVTSVNGKTGNVTINLADVLGASGAQVKLCAATEFTANTIETWNAYYEDGYRIVGVVNDDATTVDYLYLLKQDENNHKPIKFGSGNGAGAVDSVNGKTGVVTINLADVLGASGAQVKLCTATEFKANTIETWNAYYEDGYRIVGVVNDGATTVDYLYLLKQDENNHQPIKFGSGNGGGAVDSVNGQTGVVIVGEAGVVEEESEATQYMQVFVDESQDYEPIVNVNQLDGKTWAEMLLEIYPVGSIYMSVNNVSPASLFGGTWEHLKDRFLLGAGDTYAAGDTGGEAAVTLTVRQMPEHRHMLRKESSTPSTEFLPYAATSDSDGDPGSSESDGVKRNTTYAGGGEAHNNMPPYVAVYMWKRVS